MEDEFIVYSMVVQEVIWLKRFFMNVGIQDDMVGPIVIHCDNQAVITFTKDTQFYNRTKYINT